mmetsp:Transcript_121642/g.211307  ORF Transcript_121642/g.211307 Transcript_121642/m.211307 type:complete len:88 (+) Transcript_121642:211-474(+)
MAFEAHEGNFTTREDAGTSISTFHELQTLSSRIFAIKNIVPKWHVFWFVSLQTARHFCVVLFHGVNSLQAGCFVLAIGDMGPTFFAA